jgi:hypothetical protein
VIVIPIGVHSYGKQYNELYIDARQLLQGVDLNAEVERMDDAKAQYPVVGSRPGTYILDLAKKPEFEWAMVGFIGVCVVGRALSIYGWVGRSRRK